MAFLSLDDYGSHDSTIPESGGSYSPAKVDFPHRTSRNDFGHERSEILSLWVSHLGRRFYLCRFIYLCTSTCMLEWM